MKLKYEGKEYRMVIIGKARLSDLDALQHETGLKNKEFQEKAESIGFQNAAAVYLSLRRAGVFLPFETCFNFVPDEDFEFVREPIDDVQEAEASQAAAGLDPTTARTDSVPGVEQALPSPAPSTPSPKKTGSKPQSKRASSS